MIRNRKGDVAEIIIYLLGAAIAISVIGVVYAVNLQQAALVDVDDIHSSVSLIGSAVISQPTCLAYSETNEIGGEYYLRSERGVIDWSKLPESIDQSDWESLDVQNCITKGPYVWSVVVENNETGGSRMVGSECDRTILLTYSDILPEYSKGQGDIFLSYQTAVLGAFTYYGLTPDPRIGITKQNYEDLQDLHPATASQQVIDFGEDIWGRMGGIDYSGVVGYAGIEVPPSQEFPVLIYDPDSGNYSEGTATVYVRSKEFDLDFERVEYGKYKFTIRKTGTCDATYVYRISVLNETGGFDGVSTTYRIGKGMGIVSGKKDIVTENTVFIDYFTIKPYEPVYEMEFTVIGRTSPDRFVTVEVWPEDLPNYVKKAQVVVS